MSRLDSFIRRMMAQRACLDMAMELVRNVEGPVLELGLGNGRTYDHLREIAPRREIFVCERAVAAHPDCVPAADHLFLGDLLDSLPKVWDRFHRQTALAHMDVGTGEAEASKRLSNEIALLLAPVMRPGGIVVSDQAQDVPGWTLLPLPPGVREGRYHLYRVNP